MRCESDFMPSDVMKMAEAGQESEVGDLTRPCYNQIP